MGGNCWEYYRSKLQSQKNKVQEIIQTQRFTWFFLNWTMSMATREFSSLYSGDEIGI